LSDEGVDWDGVEVVVRAFDVLDRTDDLDPSDDGDITGVRLIRLGVDGVADGGDRSTLFDGVLNESREFISYADKKNFTCVRYLC